MRVAVLGRTSMLMNSISLIEQSRHEIVLIGTCKAAEEYDTVEKDFKEKAEQLGIPFFCSSKINSEEIIQVMQDVHADIAVSVNWLTIIGERAMQCFPYGVLNAHIGDLPRYRGNACPNWAIIQGEPYVGITIHKMVPNELDAGDIIVKELFELKEDTDITQIYQYSEKRIPELFIEALDAIEGDKNTGAVQSKEPEDILRCYPRIPSDSFIDWNEPCENIKKLIYASGKPFSGAYTYFNGYKIRVFRCRIEKFETPVLVVPGQVVSIDKINNSITVAAKDGLIVIEQSQVDDCEKLITDIIISVRSRLNYSVQDKIYELDGKISELEEKLAVEKKQDLMQNKYNRILPISELFVDRWEKAKKLGWGNGTSVYDSCIVMGDVRVGNNCWIGPNTLLDGTGGGIVIGDYCDISAGVQIYTHDSIERCLTGAHALNRENGKVEIGNHCYIAPQCIISKAVTIGDRCVIAANSFVNKNFGNNCVIAGTPAKQVGQVYITENREVLLKYFKKEDKSK